MFLSFIDGVIFSRVLRDSIPRFVRSSVGHSVSPSHFTFLFYSRVLRDSTTRFVGPSVRRSVRPSVGPSVRPSVTLYLFWVFAVFGLTAPAQMME